MEEKRTRSVFGCILDKPLTAELKSGQKDKSMQSGKIKVRTNSDSYESPDGAIASENSRLWADYYSSQRGGTSNERA